MEDHPTLAQHSLNWAWHSSAPACFFSFLYVQLYKYLLPRLRCNFLGRCPWSCIKSLRRWCTIVTIMSLPFSKLNFSNKHTIMFIYNVYNPEIYITFLTIYLNLEIYNSQKMSKIQNIFFDKNKSQHFSFSCSLP